MPNPSRKDAQALASAAGGAPKAPEAMNAPIPAETPVRRERICKWTDDSQFNLAAWVAGKLRATIQVYDIPDVGKLELTFRELTGQEFREIDAMVSRAASDRSVWSDGDVARFRNVALTTAAITAVNRKPWPEPSKKTEGDAEPRPKTVEERTQLLRSSTGQTMLDMYVKACGDFNDELLQLVRGVDPKTLRQPLWQFRGSCALRGVALEPNSRTEELAFNEWSRQQLLQMRLAKLIFLAIPPPHPGASMDAVASHQTTKANAYREFIFTLFPELTDQQFEKEGELADFLKQFASKPFELRVTEGRSGSMDIALKR